MTVESCLLLLTGTTVWCLKMSWMNNIFASYIVYIRGWAKLFLICKKLLFKIKLMVFLNIRYVYKEWSKIGNVWLSWVYLALRHLLRRGELPRRGLLEHLHQARGAVAKLLKWAALVLCTNNYKHWNSIECSREYCDGCYWHCWHFSGHQSRAKWSNR